MNNNPQISTKYTKTIHRKRKKLHAELILEYHWGLLETSIRLVLYAIFFSSKVNSTLCENGPEMKTKINQNMKNERRTNNRNLEGESVQSPRIVGAPTAALTAISRAICDE